MAAWAPLKKTQAGSDLSAIANGRYMADYMRWMAAVAAGRKAVVWSRRQLVATVEGICRPVRIGESLAGGRSSLTGAARAEFEATLK